jgi:hypothetical protein
MKAPGVYIVIRDPDPDPTFEDGPIAWLVGHDSPTPWRGQCRALPGYAYFVRAHEVAGEPVGTETGPYCHVCLVEVTYALKSHVYHRWEAVLALPDLERPDCERCERVIR